MEKQVFIVREEELGKLSDVLGKAENGNGGVCFVSGEAGSGKTTLVNEFIRRAQENNPLLAVAVGICDAQTGMGDAYLPFREVLGQLTGEVESINTQGEEDEEDTSRLRNLLVMAGQAIVDVGPDLIGVFVPGIGLATKLGAFVAEKTGWLNKLENLVNKPKAKLGESGLQESHIFEQYTNVLCRISEKTPLVIFLDDLHWADAASINLLFHLGRRIGEHKILILGTYRSAETVIGRGGERHPMEKVLAEFKRYYGDITIDLDEAVDKEGKQFVEGYLESEPNALSSSFIGNLYHHTDGHPLFTVELLRDMQERGDLVKDEAGRWIESGSLNWKALPTKVEGVIEERVGRLQEELKEILVVGSVQGEDFTAEVIARVQQAEARGLLRKLSGELERQHRLVRTEGITRLESGGQRLSLFRFQHNLFRTYLYNGLSDAERAYLHEDVGQALEALYGDQADEIAVDLALHFEKAGIEEKARYYLQKAGEQAAQRYAHEESLNYLNRALALTPENDLPKQYELILCREKVKAIKGYRDEQGKDLGLLEHIVEMMDDDEKKIEIFLQKASFLIMTDQYPDAIEAAKTAIGLMKNDKDPKKLALANFHWANAIFKKGDFKSAQEKFSQTLKIAKNNDIALMESHCLRSLGVIDFYQGRLDNAKVKMEASLEISNKIGHRIASTMTLNNLALIADAQGDMSLTKAYFMEALEMAHETGNRRAEVFILDNLGVFNAKQGDLKTALTYYERTQKYAQQTEDRSSISRNLHNLGNLSTQMGNYGKAEDYFNEGLSITREIGDVQTQMCILSSYGNLETEKYEFSRAIDDLHKSQEIAKELDSKEYQAINGMKLARLNVALGDYLNAETQFAESYKLFEELDNKQGMIDVFIGRSLLFCHRAEYENALSEARKALEEAKQLGDLENQAVAALRIGDSCAALDRYTEAAIAYQEGLNIRKQMELEFRMPIIYAGMARLAWKEGDAEESLNYVLKILDYLEEKSEDKPELSLETLLICYHILDSNHDPQAEDILRKAQFLLIERAEKITDEAMRKSYLENVAVNREIQEVFARL